MLPVIEVNTEDEILPLPEPNRNMVMIREMVQDPDTPVAEISRLIALEIATLMVSIDETDPTKRGHKTPKEINDQIKGLRELQRTLAESEILSKRDTLNFDGPKFHFWMKHMILLMVDVLKTSGLHESEAKNIMAQFRDKLSTEEPRIRREINKLDVGK